MEATSHLQQLYLRLDNQVSLSNLIAGQALDPISLRHKPKRVSQVDEHEDDHEEHNEKDDSPSSEGDAHVDFATLAVSYSTIGTRRDESDSCDESSDEPSTPRRPTRHPTRRL